MDPNATNLNEALSTGKIVTHPQLSYCLESPASEVRRIVGHLETGREVVACLLPACLPRRGRVINFPSGFTGATGYITLENSLVGGAIHLVLSQCGWTC